jgi:predicted ArsR family transcriptional regulator
MKTNGVRRRRVAKARLRIVTYARKHGSITNAKAKKIGGMNQVWFHLNAMAKAGVLKREEFNRWVPVKRRGRPAKNIEI